MAKIHLICGFMGFGKTTFSKDLATKLPAVCLTHDEFMVDLYGRNMPYADFHTHYHQVDTVLWKLAKQILSTGTDVIMDYGFWNRQTRAEVQQKAKSLTPDVVWHQMVCDPETAKKRVLKRTREKDSELFIDEACFDEKLKQYEPISPDENLTVIYHKS